AGAGAWVCVLVCGVPGADGAGGRSGAVLRGGWDGLWSHRGRHGREWTAPVRVRGPVARGWPCAVTTRRAAPRDVRSGISPIGRPAPTGFWGKAPAVGPVSACPLYGIRPGGDREAGATGLTHRW